MTTLEQLKSEIDSLSPEDREKLTTSLAYSDSRMSTSLSRSEQDVIDILLQITGSRVPARILVRDYGVQKFKGRVAELLNFISESRSMLRQSQVRGLIEKCLRCLASDLRGREIPATPATILNSMGLLRHSVDQRFPGYAAAGHLHRLVGGAKQAIQAAVE